MDQVATVLKKSPVKFVDPREELNDAKKIQSYRKYDTHWNEYGAFVAYSKLQTVIADDIENIKPRIFNDFSIVYEKARSNDLLTMLAMEGQFEPFQS